VIDMSSVVRKAMRDNLPKAKRRLNHFQEIHRANLMTTLVNRRRSYEVFDRRGRALGPPYKYQKLLTCSLEELSVDQA